MWDIDYFIDLIPREVLVSKTPYDMSVLELSEVKMQLHEFRDKGYIFPSISP